MKQSTIDIATKYFFQKPVPRWWLIAAGLLGKPFVLTDRWGDSQRGGVIIAGCKCLGRTYVSNLWIYS